jgi:hypothetical protein
VLYFSIYVNIYILSLIGNKLYAPYQKIFKLSKIKADHIEHLKKNCAKKKRQEKMDQLWVDKYRPRELSKLSYHADLIQLL